MDYIASVTSNFFSITFTIFLIGSLGYLLGAIEIKGISLGTAGVLLAALSYGVAVSFVPELQIGSAEVVLFDESIKAQFNLIASLGTAMFVTSVGLIAGPQFFRTFNKSSMSYIGMGTTTISFGALLTIGIILMDKELPASMAVGLMTGALTSTPGLSAAKEVAGEAIDMVTAGYGIAYIFGVLGKVLFVQLMPRILRVDIAKERERFVAENSVKLKSIECTVKQIEPHGFFPFFLSIAMGCFIGGIKFPGINFTLGNSGGYLIAGLLLGHVGHLGSISLRVEKNTLNFYRELGLVLFLIGSGVPGGINFISNIKFKYFVYGLLITVIPMVISYFVGRYIFKLEFLNNLGAITGGMTSTPALGILIATAGTDKVASAYAATYPVALVCIVFVSKLIVSIF